MSSIFARRTLLATISKDFAPMRGLFCFLITLPLIILALEFVGRSALGAHLPAPIISPRNYLFNKKIYDLEAQIRRDGRLDCVFVGSSVAHRDIDPEIVGRVYHEKTGSTIHCYNLGIPVLTAENTATLTSAFIRHFQPQVVLFPVLARDIDPYEFNADYFEESKWVQYNNGQKSTEGWLLNNSYAYKYYLTWRAMLLPQNRINMVSQTKKVTAAGFEPVKGQRDPNTPVPRTTADQLAQIWTSPRHAETISAILALQTQSVHIVLIEGPELQTAASPGVSDPFKTAYESIYIPGLLGESAKQNAPFWRTLEIAALIPPDDWYDWRHLNSTGAQTFSEWLGEQLAQNSWLFK